MDNKLQLFQFNSQPVRVVWVGNDPMPIFADTCKCLGIGNPSDAVKRLLFKDGVVQIEVIDSMGRKQNATCISLPNYLDFVAR
jgi:prophage antirepressor-like protein